MAFSPAISVITPTCERRGPLESLLRALTSQTLPADQFEVIVIIDGSTDGTSEMVQIEAPYQLTWRWQPNSGRAAACNAGIALAKGGLIVLLDDDMEPVSAFPRAAHQPSHSWEASCGDRCRTDHDPGGIPPAVAGYIGRKFNRHIEKLESPGRTQACVILQRNFSIRRDLLLEIGGSLEDFKIYGNEDLELAWRLKCRSPRSSSAEPRSPTSITQRTSHRWPGTASPKANSRPPGQQTSGHAGRARNCRHEIRIRLCEASS